MLLVDADGRLQELGELEELERPERPGELGPPSGCADGEVEGEGEGRRGEGGAARADTRLMAARLGLGLLGPLVELELQCVRAYHVRRKVRDWLGG